MGNSKNKFETSKEGLPLYIKLIIVIISLLSGILGSFINPPVSDMSFLFFVFSSISPFIIGGVVWVLIMVISRLFKKHPNEIKIYFYCVFIVAGALIFNNVAEVTEYSEKSVLILLAFLSFIWWLERKYQK